jgi:hypothetical protein
MATHYAPGRYVVRVADQKFTQSRQKGTLGFVLEFIVLQSLDHPEMPHQGFCPAMVMWITEKTLPRVIDDLHRLGYVGKTLAGVDPDTRGFHDFRGAKIELVCEHEEGEKGLFERWSLPALVLPNLADKAKIREFDHMLAATPAPPPPPPGINGRAARLREFDRMLAATPAPTPTPTPAPPPPGGADNLDITDDDVAF